MSTLRQPITAGTVTAGGNSPVDVGRFARVTIIGVPGKVVEIKTGPSSKELNAVKGELYDPSEAEFTDVIPASGVLSYIGGADFIQVPSCVLLLSVM